MLKRDISNNNLQFGKRMLADIICYWKMMSSMALASVTLLRLKEATNACKRMRRSLTIGGSSSVQWGKVGRS